MDGAGFSTKRRSTAGWSSAMSASGTVRISPNACVQVQTVALSGPQSIDAERAHLPHTALGRSLHAHEHGHLRQRAHLTDVDSHAANLRRDRASRAGEARTSGQLAGRGQAPRTTWSRTEPQSLENSELLLRMSFAATCVLRSLRKPVSTQPGVM